MADRRCYEDFAFDPEGDCPVSLKPEKLLLDALNVKLLRLLREDPRIAVSELARRVAMSAPAVPERGQRLAEAGVITCYRPRPRAPRPGVPPAALRGRPPATRR